MYYNIHGLVKIKVFKDALPALIKSLDFQISHFKQSSPLRDPNIEIRSYSDFPKGDTEIFHLVQGSNHKLYHDSKRKLAFEKKEHAFIIYSDYPNFLINLFIQMLIGEYGYSFIHAAGVVGKSKNYIFPGAGGVGKTALLSQLIKNDEYKVMGDDLLIISQNGECLSFPREFVLKDYHKHDYADLFKKRKIRKNPVNFKKFILNNMPLADFLKNQLKKSGIHHQIADRLNLSPYCATLPVTDIFGPNSISDRASNSIVVLLGRHRISDFKVETPSSKDLASSIFSTIHHEWYESSQLMYACGALNLWHLGDYFKKTQDTIDQFLNGKKIYKIYIPNTATSLDLYSFFKHEIDEA